MRDRALKRVEISLHSASLLLAVCALLLAVQGRAATAAAKATVQEVHALLPPLEAAPAAEADRKGERSFRQLTDGGPVTVQSQELRKSAAGRYRSVVTVTAAADALSSLFTALERSREEITSLSLEIDGGRAIVRLSVEELQ